MADMETVIILVGSATVYALFYLMAIVIIMENRA
jgi:hypothetical protein